MLGPMARRSKATFMPQQGNNVPLGMVTTASTSRMEVEQGLVLASMPSWVGPS